MTYRECRLFVYILRDLGCPVPVAIDAFDQPNFTMMADCLRWLVHVYDPDIIVIGDIKTELSRVDFVKSAVGELARRSGIRLHPRRLYGGDRFAVREMLKLASQIHRGYSVTPVPAGEKLTAPGTAAKIARMSSTLPQKAVELYDGLMKESQVRDERTRILQRLPPLEDMEKSVEKAVKAATARLAILEKELEKLAGDENTLRSKIKQRRTELDRQTKRLISVSTVRPAFMDEYEALESELKELFKIHFQHFRNVDYYQHELALEEELARERKAEQQAQISKIQRQTKDKILMGMRDSFHPGASPGEEFAAHPLENPGPDESDGDF